MPRYLVAIHHPDDYNPAVVEDDAMRRDIDDLNQAMVAEGIRVFVGGLKPVSAAHALRRTPGGEILVTDGPYIESKEHIGGFWVLDLPDEATALDWGRRAAMACRAPVEVRAFH
ncbi:YciI family protein [Devosia aquimaris]|uniref:YciI family protein n=1 Tax=Devosia aquimaris TaxID=2866214 RepID=UPI001CD143F7|nr:YciI family protein [Devosia sp. CJK-A8-3]